jgi:hypothetical protein
MKRTHSAWPASIYFGAAALCLVFAIAQPVKAMMMVPTPIHLESLEQVESKGLCFISRCEEYGANARLQPAEIAQLNSWRSSDRPWARVLSLICDPDGNCFKAAANNRLPMTKLASALKDPAAQVRALALTQLDLHSEGARLAAEVLLDDAAWVEPLAHTVADHAYFVLSTAIPKDYTSRNHSAINSARGISDIASLRMPYAKRAADWRLQLATYPNANNEPIQSDSGQENVTSFWRRPEVLAGLWHGASERELEAALDHPNPTIRLTAFDALLIREQRNDSAALAIRALELGGSTEVGDCMPFHQSISLALFEAILQSGKIDQATAFIDSLDVQTDARPSLKLLGDPIWEISEFLSRTPSDAALFAPTLRRWALADQGNAVSALSAAGQTADLPYLLSVAKQGDFSALMGRDDAEIVAEAKSYYQARRAVLSTSKRDKLGVSYAWFQYVYSLPSAKASELIAEIFSEDTPPKARTKQLQTLYSALSHANGTGKELLGSLLWQRHQILLPQHAAAVLAADPNAGKTAAALLSNDQWRSQITDLLELEKSTYCSAYSEIITALLRRLPTKAQGIYLTHAMNHEAPCAIASLVNASNAGSIEAVQALTARVAREKGEVKSLVAAALKATEYAWPQTRAR